MSGSNAVFGLKFLWDLLTLRRIKGCGMPDPHPAFMTFIETKQTLVSAEKRAVPKGGESSRNQALSMEI
jgi:hypothetical protein